MSLVGFDDTEAVTDEFGENILTTVRLPLLEIGREGTKLLVRQIMGEEKEQKEIVLPVKLVVRKSTTRPNTAWLAGHRPAKIGPGLQIPVHPLANY